MLHFLNRKQHKEVCFVFYVLLFHVKTAQLCKCLLSGGEVALTTLSEADSCSVAVVFSPVAAFLSISFLDREVRCPLNGTLMVLLTEGMGDRDSRAAHPQSK